MSEYLIIIEKTKNGFSAYSPDIEGCIAVGVSKEECEQNMKDALKHHIEYMLELGIEVPKPKKRLIEFVKVKHKLPTKRLTTLA